MMRFQAERCVVLFGPLLLVAACSCGNNSVANLDERLQLRLAPEIAAGHAGLEQLPDGARVTFSEQTLFPPGRAELDDSGRFIMASFIQGLLDPGILRIQIAEPPASSVYVQGSRTKSVTEYFVDYGLGPSLQPAAVPAGSADSAPQNLAITVSVIPG
jgi:hypothetical protein